MARGRKTLGQDAKCSVLLSYLRPSARIDQQFPNKVAGQRLEDLKVLRLSEVTRLGNKYLAVFFRSETFGDDVELYATRRYVKVLDEGPSGLFFDVPTSPQALDASVTQNFEDRGDEITADTFNRTGDAAEDIRNVLAQGLAIDDDSAPAPENIPTATATAERDTNGLFLGQTFAWNGVCQRKLMTNQKLPPGFNNWKPLANPSSTSFTSSSPSNGSSTLASSTPATPLSKPA